MLEQLRKLVGEDHVWTDEPMKNHTTFRAGGCADYLVEPESEEEVRSVIRLCQQEQIPYYIVGNGSNLLVSDEGYRGVIFHIYKNMSAFEIKENYLKAQAGALLVRVAKAAAKEGLSGLEFASGIPGTVGGAMVMNAGAYGGEMKDVVRKVRVLLPDGTIREHTGEEMNFGYRKSRVMEEQGIVLGAEMELTPDDPEVIASRMEELKNKRVTKQPLEYASAGSTFKRPEGYFAGKLIEEAGLRGFCVGDAQVSEKHCGFVINRGNATATEIMELIREVQKRVYEHSGVHLETEVKLLGF